MACEHEMDFLFDILEKCHINSVLISLDDDVKSAVNSQPNRVKVAYQCPNATIRKIAGNVENVTRYEFTDELKQRYIFMRIPHLSEKDILFIGPFVSAPFSTKEILEVGERARLSPNMQKHLKEYYASVPIVAENDRILIVIDTFCERIWKTQAFSIVELDGKRASSPLYDQSSSYGENASDIFADMERMERRYAFENELLQAVRLGQQHREKLLLSSFDEQVFEKRLQDTSRNAKNYGIIMNTLLRKAAEQGGVHPLYIDSVSSKFAAKIEQVAETKQIIGLMGEMFSTYCRLVQKHSIQKYSPVVKKTVLMIDADISAELSLGILAKNQGVTTGYLATVFKKETGKTVSEYLRDKRMQYATHLLKSTSLQVQTIAMHCGIMDVQYFSKIFKRQTGKTPNEYRKEFKK